MTREEALRRLERAREIGPEEGHIEADRVLCELLQQLGYEDVVEAWDEIQKWYA